jgi:hypothetical protein
MPSLKTISLVLAVLSPTLLVAETRAWKSSDGLRSVNGEFIKRAATTITIRNETGKDTIIELAKLHPDDIKWLDTHQPITAPVKIPPPTKTPEATSHSFFDDLTFQDTRESTLAKLKASKVVELTTGETFIGRSGLNGIFRTRHKIGGLSGFLYFDWTEAGTLKELTLQTEPLPANAYKTTLEPSWKGFTELLSTLYGKPVQKGPLPSKESIPDGSFFPSHLWALETGGSALLGTARDGDKYQVVVRFSQKMIRPVESP